MGIKKTNGCSFIPDMGQTSCCNAHDLAYVWKDSRKKADQELRDCIKKSGHPYLAFFVYVGVRLFGWPFWHITKYKVRMLRERA